MLKNKSKNAFKQFNVNSAISDPEFGAGHSTQPPLIHTLKSPIRILSAVETFDFNQNDMQALKKAFHHLPPDIYLQRQKCIEKAFLNLDIGQYWDNICQFYTGAMDEAQFFQRTGIKLVIDQEPTRFRGVSSYTVTKDSAGDILIQQRDPILFCQPEALKTDGGHDLRVIPRMIPELPAEDVNSVLKQFIQKSSALAFDVSGAQALVVTLHHMRVVSRNRGVASNSPEGAHQDGMDFIISAFVVNRDNVVGGESIIYGSDQSTKVVEVLLEEGMGLFQPDKGTDLWHEVAAITPKQKDALAVRDIIGVDFSVVS